MKEFATKDELFKYLKENKELLIMEKKSATKQADAIMCSFSEEGNIVNKAEEGDSDILHAKLVINTTNLFDSHRDVHIPGIWNKSLKDKRKTRLLQEHVMSFDHVISDKVIPSVKNMLWSDLGFSYPGKTQALIFDAELDPTRNPFMYQQYKKAYVDNHSVGMQYVTVYLCINSDDRYYRDEKENWDKYAEQVANLEDAKAVGYFWAVTEAKLIEGSAVLYGANFATPTLSIKSGEPSNDTQKDMTADDVTVEDFKQIFRNLKNN